MIITFDIIITAIVLIGLFIASITDLKTREIPDWLSYGLLFFVILTRILQTSIERSYSILIPTIIAFAIFFAFGNLMYFTKQWGGGDTKLIAAIGTAFAVQPSYLTTPSLFPFPVVLVINIFLVGAIYGLIYATVLAIKHSKDFKKQFKKINSQSDIKKIKWIIFIMAILIVITSFFFLPLDLRILSSIIAVILLTIPYMLAMIKSVEFSCMYKKLKPSQLTEGDWVQKNIYKNKKLIYKVNPYGIDQKAINILKKAKIKEVLVKEGIPFIPSFFIGTLLTIILANIIFFF
jgi:Flp pilus assembly protein protease CpaA